MNQPSLKKVHSVDYAGGLQQRGVAAGSTRNNKPLMHSVSIVVELAKESPVVHCGFEGDTSEELDVKDVVEFSSMTTNDLSGTQRRLVASPEAKSIDTDSYDEEEEEEEEEDEGDDESADDDEEEELEGLSSSLARRVVIVDEADKILLARAQSAEPRLLEGDTPHWQPAARSPTTMGSSDFVGTTQQLTRPLLTKRQSLALTPGAGGTCSGELAERGALKLLGMRRNTHHHVNIPTLANTRPTGAAAAAAASVNHPGEPVRASAQAGSCCGDSPPAPASRCSRQALKYHYQPSSPVSLRNWSQRRQSLQISLLSGSDFCSSSSSSSISKSLTEEELRGEREFNEQVRQAKSPDIFAQPATAAASISRHPSPAPAAAARCQLASKPLSVEPASSPSKLLPGSQPQQQQQQQQLKQRTQAQRRVSFGSIDPLLKQRQSNTRSSFAYYPIPHSSIQHNQDTSAPRLEDICSKHLAEKQRKSCVILSKQKRHSLAVASYQSGARQRQRERPGEKQQTHSLADNAASFWDSPSSAFASNRSVEDLFSSGGSCSSEPTSNDEARLLMTTASSSNSSNKAAASHHQTVGYSSTLRKMNDNSIVEKDCASESSQAVPTEISMATTKLVEQSNPQQQDSQSDSKEVSSTTSAITFKTHKAPNNQVQEKESNKIQSIMANARLRQEEFARLLEEHEQIVNEINRVETKISSSQTNLQNQQENK